MRDVCLRSEAFKRKKKKTHLLAKKGGREKPEEEGETTDEANMKLACSIPENFPRNKVWGGLNGGKKTARIGKKQTLRGAPSRPSH